MPGPINNSHMRALVNQLLDAEALSGEMKAGDAIEIVNVSASPEQAFHANRAARFAADESGALLGDLSQVQPGDHLRVRTRLANGEVSSWISLQAGQNGAAGDTRNAQVGLRGLGIEVDQEGKLRPKHLGGGMFSEPGTDVQLTNMRTGEKHRFTLDEQGRIPTDIALPGQAGDSFQLAVSDGVNNTDFSMAVVNPVVAKSQVDVADPVATARFSGAQKVRYSGPLFLNGASASDVKQGSLGNCYFVAAASTVAHFHPELIENMIKDNGNGTYTVTFQLEQPADSGQYVPTPVTVDGELYLRHNQVPVFGAANADGANPEKMEMWYPILEKAYAALKGGGYQGIESGWSHKMMMMFTGSRVNDEHYLPHKQADQIFEQLKEASENGWPGTAVTFDKSSQENSRYSGSRIYASHAYSVLGVEEKDGEKLVQLRNPWGSSEPGYDGKDDGIFTLNMDQFLHYFQWLNVTHTGE